MHIRNHNNAFVTADVYPHAAPDAQPLFLASSPHFVVIPDGTVTYNAKPVTLAEEAKRAGEYLLALIEAERIAGKVFDDRVERAERYLIKSLAQSLANVGEDAP